jgi:hypothetical protein
MLQVNLAQNGEVIDRTDDSLLVRFFLHPELDELKSDEEGRPIYRDIEMVEIMSAGSRDVLHKKSDDISRRRFRRQYEAFKSANSEVLVGTPLGQFPFISASERKELEYFNIFTGEQLIAMPDGNIDKVGVNGRDLIKKVKAFIELAKDTSIVSRMTSENESLKREMALIKEQMDQILKMKQDSDSQTKGSKVKKGI